MARSMMMFMMMTMIASMHMHGIMAQTRHVVGDALGWNIPSGGAAAYTTWASRQTFNVGDTLFFNFTTGFHNVAEVTQAAYGPCTTTNPIPIATTTTGPATVTLTTSGEHYYICTVGTHCNLGQKLAINVSAAATPTPASPPTTTATPPPTSASPASSPVGVSPVSPPSQVPATPSPAGDATPPPPPSSAAVPSFTAVAPATLLAVVLGFFY